MTTTSLDDTPVPVDPARLASGVFDPATGRTTGEGDIAASYSADRIGMGRPLRRPFPWRGGQWVCTGLGPHGTEVYRLLDPTAFPGAPTTYPEKTRHAEAARRDPLGFYHGMVVRHAGRTLVITGPKATLVPGDDPEPSLFAALERHQDRGR